MSAPGSPTAPCATPPLTPMTTKRRCTSIARRRPSSPTQGRCCPAWKPAMAENPAIEIEPHHLAIVRDILRRRVPGNAVWAFGSRARRVAKPYSDLDLAIITDRPLPWAVAAALAEDFSDSDLPWRVDIVDW